MAWKWEDASLGQRVLAVIGMVIFAVFVVSLFVNPSSEGCDHDDRRDGEHDPECVEERSP